MCQNSTASDDGTIATNQATKSFFVQFIWPHISYYLK